MLPDKNQLDDELIEQVGGGSLDVPELDERNSHEADSLLDIIADSLENEDTHERTNEHSRNRKPEPISKITPIGDLKTTVPNLPKKDKLIKMH